jgi:hypothetical protein
MIFSVSDVKFRYALIAGALALGVAVSAAPAKASMVTETVSFTDTGTYFSGVYSGCCAASYGNNGYNPLGVVSASFVIQFNPTQAYLDQPLTGVIKDLKYSVTDPFFSPALLTFNAIADFTFDYNTLTLFSLANAYGGGALPAGTSDITLVFSNFAGGGTPGSGAYYSQAGFPDDLTTSGSVSISPLPPSWTMLIAGFVGLFGFVAFGGKKRNAAAMASA